MDRTSLHARFALRAVVLSRRRAVRQARLALCAFVRSCRRAVFGRSFCHLVAPI